MNTRSLIIAAALLVAPAAGAEVLSNCGCKAVRNVKNRLCETRAAQREFDRLASHFLAEEKAKGAPIMMDGDIKENIEKCGVEALSQADDTEAQSATAHTDRSCAISVPETTRAHLDPSYCVGQSVLKHEEFHRQACLQRQQGKWERIWAGRAPATAAVSTMFEMSVVDYLAEEAAAYMLEESDLTDTLKQLVATCKPSELQVKIVDDGEVPGKKAGDTYKFDLSMEGCPTRPRKSPSVCAYPP